MLHVSSLQLLWQGRKRIYQSHKRPEKQFGWAFGGEHNLIPLPDYLSSQVNGRPDFGVTFNTEILELAEEKSIEDNMEGGDDSQDMQVDNPTVLCAMLNSSQVESDASAEISVYDALSSGTCRWEE